MRKREREIHDKKSILCEENIQYELGGLRLVLNRSCASFHSILRSTPDVSRMFQSTPEVSRMFQRVLEYTSIFYNS